MSYKAVKKRTAKGLETIAKCKKAYNEIKGPTPKKVAERIGMVSRTVSYLWPDITGKTWEEDLRTKIRAYIMLYPESTPEECSEFMDIPIKSINQFWDHIMTEGSVGSEKEDILLTGVTQIPDFVPKAKPFVDRDGNKCTDVSEFFGITEYGGECYKNVHYTIPKGVSNTFKGSQSDFYI